MSQTPTPETDAVVKESKVYLDRPWTAYCQVYELARKLERERDRALADMKDYKESYIKHTNELAKAQADCAAKDEALKCAEERLPEFSSVKKIIKQALSLNSGAELLERLEKAEHARDSHAKDLKGYQDAWYKLNEANDQLRKVAEWAKNLNF